MIIAEPVGQAPAPALILKRCHEEVHMQNEITEKDTLLDDRGFLKHKGYSRFPVLEYNPENIRVYPLSFLNRLRLKEWDYYGLTTSFNRSRIKPGVTVLAEEPGAPWVKYLHGEFGEGTWTFLGGHDPEDPQHQIGDPPTDLSLYPNSPGYRLILNNVLFPAARKRELKT